MTEAEYSAKKEAERFARMREGFEGRYKHRWQYNMTDEEWEAARRACEPPEKPQTSG